MLTLKFVLCSTLLTSELAYSEINNNFQPTPQILQLCSTFCGWTVQHLQVFELHLCYGVSTASLPILTKHEITATAYKVSNSGMGRGRKKASNCSRSGQIIPGSVAKPWTVI